MFQIFLSALGLMALGMAVAIFALGLMGALPMVVAAFGATLVGTGGVGFIFAPLIDPNF